VPEPGGREYGRLQRVLGAEPVGAWGYVLPFTDDVRYAGHFHDMRKIPQHDRADSTGETKKADTDEGYTIGVRFQLPTKEFVHGTFVGGLGNRSTPPTHVFTGSEGTIVGSLSDDSIKFRPIAGTDWVDLPIRIVTDDPDENRVQRNWNRFFQLFVADVTGASMDEPYPTFADGFFCCRIMDVVRAGTFEELGHL